MTSLKSKINCNLNVVYISYIMALMSTINYPTAISTKNKSQTKDYHSGRGMRLEADVNESNKYYRAIDKALIYKKPTPVQVVRVDYPNRRHAKIVEAYYRTPSTTDYNGVYKGKYIDFEAKETQNKTSFPNFMIHDHQIEHLEKVHLHGGIGFFLIRFTHYNYTFLVDAPLLISQIKKSNKSSVALSWFKEHGYLIEEKFRPRLDYLSVVDAVYFKEEK